MNEGLKHLAVEGEKSGVNFQDLNRVVILPFYSFLDSIYELMRNYIKNPHFSSWAEFIAVESNDRHISNLFGSWLKYNNKSLESKLVSMLLPSSSISKLKIFLKLRKETLKTSNKITRTLDEILLQHEDIIGILHNVYTSVESRKAISEGIKSLFISYKMQQAKIYSCVFIEYALSLHDTLHNRENTEATVQNQTINYGTIPQSILCYSSIASHASNNKPALRQNVNQSIHDNQEASRKYISNFQSVIHDENGLYRKVKSSQVSLEGYRVIDHKFHNDSVDKSLINKSQMMMSKSNIKVGKPKSRALLIAENEYDRNEKSRSASPQKEFEGRVSRNIFGNQSQEKKIDDDNFDIKRQEKLMKRVNTNDREGYTESRFINENEITPTKNSKMSYEREGEYSRNNYDNYDSNTKSIKSLTYSQKYKSPDLSYDLTAAKGNSISKSNNSQFRHREEGTLRDPCKESSYIKLMEVPESEEHPDISQNTKEKQGGNDMFSKLMERNRSFREKMLNAEYDKNNTNVVVDEEGNANFESLESISVIHDSIVRHSKMDRWSRAGMN